MADYVAKWRADTRTQARFSFLIRRFRERPVRDHCSRSCLVAKGRVIPSNRLFGPGHRPTPQ